MLSPLALECPSAIAYNVLAVAKQYVALCVFHVGQVRLWCVLVWRRVVEQYVDASIEEGR